MTLRPDPARTVARPFLPSYPQAFRADRRDRAQAIAERVLALDDAAAEREIDDVGRRLRGRHRDVDAMLLRQFDAIGPALKLDRRPGERRRRLIGAYFTQEYAFEAAALFNPSVVAHPDQSGAPSGELRLVVSLRGIGEGHVSSVAFRTGSWTADGGVVLDDPGRNTQPPSIEGGGSDQAATRAVLHCGGSRTLSENVLFPVTAGQARGLEDLRLVRFAEDDGGVVYHGVYTAFSGAEARSELLTTSDFRDVELRALRGSGAAAKGMALFPRRLDGRFAMLGRQDGENIWLLRSDDLLAWDGGEVVVAPRFPWEFVQIGNCGSPLEVDEGWLVLTHGVGTVRNYCMGACLLDRKDPSRLLARTPRPILAPGPQERDGYVPNVVYSCGALLRGRDLLLPYGVADSFTSFAATTVDELLAFMS